MGLGLNIRRQRRRHRPPRPLRRPLRAAVPRRPRAGADGRWTTELVDISQPPPTFIMDLARIEVGWLAYGPTGPDHRLVPSARRCRRSRARTTSRASRCWLYAEKLLGGVREFASTAKVVIAAMDALHNAFEAAPERGQGLVPVVSLSGASPSPPSGRRAAAPTTARASRS